MNTKILLASVAVAVVAAALIGVAAAEFATQNQTVPNWVNSQVNSPAYGDQYPNCYNSTTGEPCWTQNGAAEDSACGYGAGCLGIAYGEQNQNQYRCSSGFMGRGGVGLGGCWR